MCADTQEQGYSTIEIYLELRYSNADTIPGVAIEQLRLSTSMILVKELINIQL